MKIGIIGCAGRMGRHLLQQVLEHKTCVLTGGLDRTESPTLGRDLGELAGLPAIGLFSTDDIAPLVEMSDALIDFTSPHLTLQVAELAAKHKKIHVIGTTGFSEKELSDIEHFSKQTCIVLSSNFSIGVNLLLKLTQQTAALLGNDFDIEIVEMHHNRKVDAPSGTALSLGKAAALGREVALEDVACYERHGLVGARKAGEIGFATLRGGNVVGDHTVIFAGASERIELTHKAGNRTVFAEGALRAAIWAKGHEHGLYSMQDVLA